MNIYRMQHFSHITREYLDTFQCILEKMIQEMTGADLTDSISRNFIVQMIPHHQAAIEMSQNILKYTTNLSLESIASGIITVQTQSIEQMRTIECVCSSVRNSEEELCRYQQQLDRIMRIMFCRMRTARATNSVDCDFMWEMIPHHEGAVEMSETTLQYEICPELKPILEAIITSQKRGISQMQNLLRRIGC